MKIIKAIICCLAFGFITPSAVAQQSDDTERRVQAIVWLDTFDLRNPNDQRLGIENWFDREDVPYAKDASLKEIHIALDTTEVAGRSTFESLCEAYTDIADWTIYVKDLKGKYIFATTCPGGQS